jgi:hypothetical protein
LTDAAPSGKWNLLMKARILEFEFPPGWSQPLTKLAKKKQRDRASRTKATNISKLESEQIAKARKQQGLSQRKLAEILGKSQSKVLQLFVKFNLYFLTLVTNGVSGEKIIQISIIFGYPNKFLTVSYKFLTVSYSTIALG